MRIQFKRTIATAVAVLALSTMNTPAHAAATQADVDYSTKVAALVQEFGKVATAWGAATANPPSLAIGSKYTAYKAKAIKTSDAVLVTVKKMKALTPSEGFAKSGPALTKIMTAYETAVTSVKNAISKNDAKGMKKANALITSASNDYAAWAKTFGEDVATLNG